MAVYIGDKNITEVLAGNALDSAKQYADQGDANTLQQAKEYTDSEVSQFEADYKQADATVLSEAKQYADQNMIPKSQKGQPGGLAELDETGRVPSSQLPSYVDDVIDVDSYSNLPNPGESGKIYITTDNNKQYRWSGTGYAEISSSLALGTTSETAGRGDWTQAAYNHSLITNGSNPHKTTFASLPDAPTSLPANGGNAESAVKDGNGNVIANSYLPLTGGKAITGSFTLAVGCKILEAEKNIIGRFVFGTDTNARTIVGAFDNDTMLISKSALKRNTNGTEYTIYDSGNLNPVTIDSDQIITGWKRFTPKTKNGVYNTSGKLGTKDTYGTPFSWNVNSGGSIWNVQQESDLVTLIGVQNGRAIKLHSSLSESQITADKFNGTASNILDRSNNSSKSIWTGTQAEYDAISTKDSNTIYFIV